MGERTDAEPTARPPRIRAAIKRVELVARAVAPQETAKDKAIKISTFFRPYLSVKMPDPKAPIIAPTSNELTPHPS